eukprot:TRINITY_DN2164_c0_g1_i2.p1 TRINITY_DN2164_c0_g1~~TRINITY_DN2164_c0_g1_i2.p1  ORF type:complete len:320 (+),score=65.38 TRINITY_DN2164_c0_g1_i2:85-1044(+)
MELNPGSPQSVGQAHDPHVHHHAHQLSHSHQHALSHPLPMPHQMPHPHPHQHQHHHQHHQHQHHDIVEHQGVVDPNVNWEDHTPPHQQEAQIQMLQQMVVKQTEMIHQLQKGYRPSRRDRKEDVLNAIAQEAAQEAGKDLATMPDLEKSEFMKLAFAKYKLLGQMLRVKAQHEELVGKLDWQVASSEIAIDVAKALQVSENLAHEKLIRYLQNKRYYSKRQKVPTHEEYGVVDHNEKIGDDLTVALLSDVSGMRYQKDKNPMMMHNSHTLLQLGEKRMREPHKDDLVEEPSAKEHRAQLANATHLQAYYHHDPYQNERG